MMISQQAMMDSGPEGDSIYCRCYRGIARFFGFGRDVICHAPIKTNPDTIGITAPPLLTIVPPYEDRPVSMTEMKWRRHEQLRQTQTSTLSPAERQARQYAVRGVYAAHEGNTDEAQRLFTAAARNHHIDLSELPGFWTFPRNVMEIAVQAYENAGRIREASALGARIRTHIRPHALTPVPRNITPIPARQTKLSGNS